MTAAKSLWRHGDFMKLWTAQSVSMLGSQVTVLALPLTAVILMKASAFEVGLLGTAQYLPFLVVGLPAGVWVDRLRRRPILITADIARTVIFGFVPFMYELGELRLWMLYVVAFLAGVFTVFSDVAQLSYVPSLVSRDRIADGNAKLELSYQGSLLAGPGLGGALVQALKAPLAIVADAVSFAGSALLLTLIRQSEPAPRSAHQAATLRKEMIEGLRFVLRNRFLRPIALVTSATNIFDFFGMVQAVLTIYAIRTLHLSPARLGITLVIANGGGLLGAAVNNRIVGRLGVGGAIATSVGCSGIAILALVLANPGNAMMVLSLAIGFAYFGIAVYNINQISLRQHVTPDAMLGRMNATIRFLIWGTLPIGTFLGGVSGSALGVRPTLLIAGLAYLVCCLPLFPSPIPKLKSLADAEPADVEFPVETSAEARAKGV
jgi:MFS family permease